jgi:hypothetical protein
VGSYSANAYSDNIRVVGCYIVQAYIDGRHWHSDVGLGPRDARCVKLRRVGLQREGMHCGGIHWPSYRFPIWVGGSVHGAWGRTAWESGPTKFRIGIHYAR